MLVSESCTLHDEARGINVVLSIRFERQGICRLNRFLFGDGCRGHRLIFGFLVARERRSEKMRLCLLRAASDEANKRVLVFVCNGRQHTRRR